MTLCRKPRNLNDLARQLNVTAATVSLALRNSPLLSAEVGERIRRTAAESGFSPRSYTRRTKEKAARKPVTGAVMLLMNDHGEEDPVRDGVMPVVSQGLSRYGIEHRYVNLSRLLEEPERLSEFRAIVFCNDLQGVRLPEKFPGVQVFGWDPRGEALDRITANDDEVVSLASGQLRRAGVTRAAVVWQRNMVQIPDHPRISLFLSRMKAFGIQAEPMPFDREDPDFTERMRNLIESGDEKIGFFGFNALCGVKLCCALESLGLLRKYSPDRVVVCDKSLMLRGFFPCPVMIDLNLSVMAERAVEMLVWRLANPEAPGVLMLQTPRLLDPRTEQFQKLK